MLYYTVHMHIRVLHTDGVLSFRTIRATVLIETILAAFEMDEILYELRCVLFIRTD